MSVPSRLSSEAATEKLQKLATQYNEQYPQHPQRDKFDRLLAEYRNAEIHPVLDYKVHELFDQFIANPEIDTFVLKTTNITSRLKDFLARLIGR